MSFANIFTTRVYAVLVLFNSSFMSLATFLISVFPKHFLIICGCWYLPFLFIWSYLTSGRKSMYSVILELCLKGCNVKGINVRFIKNTSLFSWIEKHAKRFQYLLSCNKSMHHSLLQFCYISVNYDFFVCFLNLSRLGMESWGLNVNMAGGHFWKKL